MRDKTSDIISLMFASNLDEILQHIFLFLDSASLKDARCVCQKWNQFIKDRLWQSRVARKKLESRLCYQWKNKTNVKKKQFAHKKEMRGLRNLECDDEFVYWWTNDGIINMDSLSTGQLVQRLDCDYNVDDSYDYGISLYVGETEVATLSGDGKMCVWDKIKGEILYQKICTIDSDGMRFVCLKVISRGKVLVGFSDGSLALIMANQENKWSMVNTFTDLREKIFVIDNDGDWVVTGTWTDVYLWKLLNNSLVLDPRSIKIEVGMFTFSYPFIFAVGFGGLKVWNIDSKIMVNLTELAGKDRKLECSDECLAHERNSRLAEALNINNPELSSKVIPRFSDLLKEWARKDPSFCSTIHRQLTELVTLAKESRQKSRALSFPCMNRDKRQFVHEYAAHFGCSTQSYDQEPKRNVVAVAERLKACTPSTSLTEAVNSARLLKAPSQVSLSVGGVGGLVALGVKPKPQQSSQQTEDIDWFG